MRILAAGGGSGGHVTPVAAVLRELKKDKPHAEVRFWCDKAFASQAQTIIAGADPSVRIATISSGKFRRYHSLSWWRQLFRFRTIVLPNIIDFFRFLFGFIQSVARLVAWRPDVVFCKGGFVCLPIGLAAALLRIPLVIHDSDAHPGLTNRILSRFASSIATGAPLEHYPYPRSKTRYVGIPIREEFRAVNPQRRRELKKRLGFDVSVPLVVVTGGGLGARRINDTVAMILDELIKEGSVALLSGAAQYDELRSLTPSDSSRYRLFDFVSEGIHDLLNAADIVVARAGATTLLELAALHKATVIIPNAYLTGGHQLKNAAAYEEKGAAVVCSEAQLEQQPELLLGVLRDLIHDPTRRAALASGMAAFAKPHAARDVARMIVRVAMIK